MKTQFHNLTRTIPLLMVALLCFTAVPALAAPARVAILPFDIHAERELTFLQEGILDMLASRLAWQDQVVVINKNETKAALAQIEGFEGESRALLVGGKLQADYVLFGSLTVFGESVSIDAKMADVSGQQAPVPFFAQTRGMGEVIPQINQFATTINETVFGRAVAQRPVAAPAPQVAMPPAGPAQVPAPADDPRMHPEKLLQTGIQSETPTPAAGQPPTAPNPAFVVGTSAQIGAGASAFWKSHDFKAVISAMDIGDVDNDGFYEIVIAQDNKLIVYRKINGQLVKTAEIADTRSGHYLGIDIGDINGNGTPEIFVSSISLQRDRYNSFVLEHDGNQYRRIVDNSPWLYRIVRTSSGGKSLLLGQRRPFGEEDLFSTPISQLTWHNGDYVPEKEIIKGGMANVIGVAYDTIFQDGQDQLVVFSPGDRICIYQNNNLVWKGDDKHGGSLAYFNLSSSDPTELNTTQFFPIRIRIADTHGDGIGEVITASNRDIAGVLKQYRHYTKGYLQSFFWNGLSLSQQWRTPEIEGRISDFAIGDFNNDGTMELVAAVVLKEGSTAFSKKKSVILSYDLAASQP